VDLLKILHTDRQKVEVMKFESRVPPAREKKAQAVGQCKMLAVLLPRTVSHNQGAVMRPYVG